MSRSRPREGREDRVERRRAQPRRPRRPPRRGGRRARPVAGDRVRRRRRRPVAGLRRGADRQRVPRRLRHRGRSRRRRRRRRDRAGHRRLARRRAGRLVARLGADGVRRAGRRRGRGARPGVRVPGDGGQLLGLRCRRWVPAARLPDRGGGGRRLVGDHQARRHRWAGVGRHGHGAADVRGSRAVVPRSRRHHRPDLDPSGGRRSRPGARLGRARVVAARAPEGVRQRAGRPPQLRGVRADRPRCRGQGGVGAVAAVAVADRVVGDLDPRPAAARQRRHRGGSVDAAALHGAGRVRRRRGPGVLLGRGGARAGVVPRLHDDRTPGQRHALRRLPRRVRGALAGGAHRAPRRRIRLVG